MTSNIEKVSLSKTDISNEDIKILVSRCKKIKELDISHTKILIDMVVDEIVLHLSSTLEKLSLPTYSSRSSKFDCSPLFKLGSVPKLKYLWIHYNEIGIFGIGRIVDLWEKQFPKVVLSCHSYCNHKLRCGPMIIHPNIAKSDSMKEKIWEIPCEGVELSNLQEDYSEVNKDYAWRFLRHSL